MHRTLKNLIRTIPDYPKPGILFRDITTLLSHPEGFSIAVNKMAQSSMDLKISKVVGIEARGFIFGGAIAQVLGVGFVPIRKKGKLPYKTIKESYQLEYGFDQIEIHEDALSRQDRVLLVDDLIATGGTARAAVSLIQRMGAVVSACSFLINLPDLGGVKYLEDLGQKVFCLLDFEGH